MSPESTRHLLLVEDDHRIAAELVDALAARGFEVAVAPTLAAARFALGPQTDLLLVDLGLPDGDGLDLCREVRTRRPEMPLIIVTARDAPEQRVRGLDLGADDYVVKPFHLPELLARIRNLLHRADRSAGRGLVRVGDLWADPELRTAGKGEKSFELRRREFELLCFLLRHPDRPWSRAQLLDRVWGLRFDGDERTVDIHVRRLRRRIEDDPTAPRILLTEWGVGYRLVRPGAETWS